MFDSWSDTVPVTSAASINRSAQQGRQVGSFHRQISGSLKRLLDISCASFLLLLLLPALLFIAVSVKLSSPGPVFFKQRRTGLNGQIFSIFKFRTMTVMEDGDVVTHASRSDKRVTGVGAILRQTSLDELPQLINILQGDMSVVGPRPHALAHDTLYGALLPQYSDRFAVRPGLTGLAQVRGLRGEIRALDCMARRIDADADYARNWSFRGDLAIMARTVPLLLRRTNAY